MRKGEEKVEGKGGKPMKGSLRERKENWEEKYSIVLCWLF